MGDKPVYIAAALAAGTIAGIPIGAFVAINIFPVSIGDGWANIIGATLGVIGAFWIANMNFNRNLKVRDFERRQPVVKRYDYCLSELVKIATNTSTFDILPKGTSADKLLIRAEKIEELPKEVEFFNIPNSKKISQHITKSFSNISGEMEWLITNKSEVLSPHELVEIKDALTHIAQARKSMTFESYTWIRSTGSKHTHRVKITTYEFFNEIHQAYKSLIYIRALH